ncbi:MAG: vWA domain-containing protein [Chloroflexia bacterium]
MGLLTPPALLFLPLLGLIIAFYMLRLRRPETGVSSLQLWGALLRDREANARWKRLSVSLPLVLQLLIAAALILALTRPWAATPLTGGRNLLILLDTSASMASTDLSGVENRLDQAKALAWQRIAGLPANGTATLIAGGNHARVVAPQTGDREALRRALDGLSVEPTTTDLYEGFALVSGLVTAQPDPEVLVYSDGRFPDPRSAVAKIDAPIHFVSVGQRGANQAILSLSLQRNGPTASLFAQVLNASDARVSRRIDIALDGVAWAGRTLDLQPGAMVDVTFDQVPQDAQIIHAHLADKDDLALDDDAWTVSRATQAAPVLLVSDGDRFLENSLVLLPNVSLSRSAPSEYAPMLTATLTVFDRVVPTGTLPVGNLLFIAPPSSTSLFDVNGKLDTPNPVVPAGTQPTDPSAPDLLRYVDLSDLHIAAADRLERTSWARTILGSDSGPLIIAGETEGRRVAVVGFDIHDSDLPVQTAFPLLMRNLVGYLVPPPAGGMPAGVSAGDTLLLTSDVQDGVTRMTVAGPKAEALADYKVDAANYRFNFSRTGALGVYIVTQWAGGRVVRREGFAVNLFSADEAQISPLADPALPDAAATPPIGSGAEAEGARLEWWQLPAALALAVLVAEWMLGHRLGLRRLSQRLTARRKGETLANP